MVKKNLWKTWALTVFVLVCWALYFCICSAPAGAPFIYADF